MKAIILDMYGVIVKQTGDEFVPYVQQTFPGVLIWALKERNLMYIGMRFWK